MSRLIVAVFALLLAPSPALANEYLPVSGVEVFECGNKGSTYLELCIGVRNAVGSRYVAFTEMSYGVTVYDSSGVVFEGSWPGPNTTYLSTDQDYLRAIGVETSPSTRYQVEAWMQDSGNSFASSMTAASFLQERFESEGDDETVRAFVSETETRRTEERSKVERETELNVAVEFAEPRSSDPTVPDSVDEDRGSIIFNYRSLESAVDGLESDFEESLEGELQDRPQSFMDSIRTLTRRTVAFLRSLIG